MKRLYIITVLLLTTYASAQSWTANQFVNLPSINGISAGAYCDSQKGAGYNSPTQGDIEVPSDYLPCTIGPSSGLIATTAGTCLAVGFSNNNDTATRTERQISSCYNCSSLNSSGNCDLSVAIDTFTVYHNSGPNVSGDGRGFANQTYSVSTDIAIVIGGRGGATYLTCTRTDNGLAETMGISLLEVSYPTGCHVDTIAGGGVQTPATTASLPTTLSLSGTDALFNVITAFPTSVTGSGWTTYFSRHQGYAYDLNVSSWVPPIWTGTVASSAAGSGIAFGKGAATVTVTGTTPSGSVQITSGVKAQ